MNIASIGATVTNGLQSTTRGSRTEASTQDQSASASNGSGDSVTLSPAAQAIASLNAQGVTVAQVPISDPNPSSTPHWLALKGDTGSLSQSEFASTVSAFGLSTSAADQLFNQLDTNGDGSLSNAEFIKAMGATANGATPLSLELLQLMDTNHDGSVSGEEFSSLESAVVQSEQ